MIFDCECAVLLRPMRNIIPKEPPGYSCAKIPARKLSAIPGRFNTSNDVLRYTVLKRLRNESRASVWRRSQRWTQLRRWAFDPILLGPMIGSSQVCFQSNPESAKDTARGLQPWLEIQLQGKLHYARIAHADNPAEIAKSEGCVQTIEISMVEDVSGLGAELKHDAFRDVRILKK